MQDVRLALDVVDVASMGEGRAYLLNAILRHFPLAMLKFVVSRMAHVAAAHVPPVSDPPARSEASPAEVNALWAM